MKWLPRIFNTYKLKNVFTPSTVAKLTYIQRIKVEDDVVKYLNLPGMQLALYGHSGCGKTTLIINVLRRLKMKYVITRCESNTTFEDILRQAFDNLNIYYGTEVSSKVSRSLKGGLAANYKEIAANIEANNVVEHGTKAVRALPLQLTPQRLAEFLGDLNCVWIIEDFHKVDPSEKIEISDVLKIFIDTSEEYPNTKVICIGAVDTARELIECDSNLNNRIAEIYVPLMTIDELTQIAEKGFKMMNVSIPEQIIIKIVYYSNKLASVCHQICYDICYSKNIEKTTLFNRQKINGEDFKESVSAYVRKNTDTFSKIFDHAVASRHRRLAIETMINLDKEYLTIDEIYKEVRKIEEIQKNLFIFAIDELTTIECFEVVRYDQNSKKYSFSTPLFQAFVKMKLALEDLEEKQREIRKKKRYSLNDGVEERIYDEKFLEHYFRELDRYYLRNVEEVERLKEIINEYNKMKK